MKKRAFYVILFILLLLFAGGLSACQDNHNNTGKYKISFDTQGGSLINPLYLSTTDTLVLPDSPSKSGYEFDGWYMDAACTVELNPYIFKINANATLYARWVDVNLYPHAIAVSDGGHKVLAYKSSVGMTDDQLQEDWDVLICLGYLEAAKDTRITISVVVEKEGYKLKDGSLTYNTLPVVQGSFIMPAENVLIAFELEMDIYTVTVVSSANGTILADTSSAKMGEQIDVTVLPELEYRLSIIRYNTTEFSPPYFLMPAANVVVYATFEPIAGPAYEVTSGYTGQGSVVLDKSSARKGEYVEVQAIPSPGYYTESVTVNGVGVYNGHFVMPGGAAAVVAVFAPIDYATVYGISVDMQLTGGSIFSSRSQAAMGETVFLGATPLAGYTVSYFTVNGKTVSGSDIVMPGEAVTVSALFQRNARQLTAAVAVGGSVALLPHGGTAYPGEIIHIEILPDAGYVYKESSLRCNGTTMGALYIVMPDENVTISVEFLPVEVGSGANAFTVTAGAGITDGNILLSKTAADAGDLIFIEANPDAGFRLKEGTLRVNGAMYGAYYQMGTENAVVTAEFERVYTIAYYDGTGGFVYPDRIIAAEGESVAIQFGAYGTYKAAGAVLYYNDHIEITSGVFVMPADNIILYADFALIETQDYSIDCAVAVNGAITTSKNSAAAGRTVVLTVSPASGYRLASIYYLSEGSERVDLGSSFLMPAQNIYLFAEFEADGAAYDALAFFENNKSLVWDNGGKLYYQNTYNTVENFFSAYALGAYACYIEEILFAELNEIFVVVRLNNTGFAPYIANKLATGLKTDYQGDTFRCNLYGNDLLISSLPSIDEAYYLLKSGFIISGGLIYAPRPDGSLTLLTTAAYLDIQSLAIPVSVEGKAVTKIAPGALRNVPELKAVSLGVVNLLSDKSFEGLSNLIQLDLSRVSDVGEQSFHDCVSLVKFSVAAYNGKYYTRNNGSALYEKVGTQNYYRLIRYAPASSYTAYTLQTGSQKIAPYAFYGADNLTELILSTTLTTLEDYALYGMSSLTRLEMSASLAQAGYHAIYWAGGNDFNIVLQSGTKLVASNGELMVQESTGGTLSVEIDVVGTDSVHLNLLNAYRSDSYWSAYAESFWFDPGLNTTLIVNFESNGGTYVNTVTVNNNVNVNMPSPAPTRAGYVFEGWYTDNGTFANKYNFLNAVTADLRLYAHWMPEE